MLFKCPDCGRIKKLNRWIKVDKRVEQEVEEYRGEVATKLVKCPVCKIQVVKK